MEVVARISAALAWLDQALADGRGPANPGASPVVLVHGIYSSQRDLKRLAGHLRREGREVFCFDFNPCNGSCSLEELGDQLGRFIDDNVPLGKLDLVGFSMGGLVSRYYLQRLGGVDRVEHFVSLAAPHNGTLTAIVNTLPGVLQMRRGSSFLRDLERDQDCLRDIKVTSFYTPLDVMIVPPSSSILPQARNVRTWALLHPSLILEKRYLRAVSAALEG